MSQGCSFRLRECEATQFVAKHLYAVGGDGMMEKEKKENLYVYSSSAGQAKNS
jgi:hypothetical protein